MKIAISGKGGVGKSTIAAVLSLMIAERGSRVLALDCDPDANLAAALGMPEAQKAAIVPISEQVALIEERTGAKVKRYGQMFKLNPEVSDIADNYATNFSGVDLLVLGAVEEGGGGCACPESVLIRALVSDLILFKDETLIMDMEAGVEHLGRATSRGVDTMLVVVEPGLHSIDCAKRVIKMSQQIGLKDIRFIANKVDDAADEAYIREALAGYEIIETIPYSQEIRKSDRSEQSALNLLTLELKQKFANILKSLNYDL
ncbi:MAG: AAA family ATPase [Victivallaceae bacterium]|nr:AAA family ATPase [Victivallaceae bacterium]